jgi:hypothetical protein
VRISHVDGEGRRLTDLYFRYRLVRERFPKDLAEKVKAVQLGFLKAPPALEDLDDNDDVDEEEEEDNKLEDIHVDSGEEAAAGHKRTPSMELGFFGIK